MKSLIFGALFFVSIHYGWATPLPALPGTQPSDLKTQIQNFDGQVSGAGRAPFCEQCENGREENGSSNGPGSLYTMSGALADMKSEPLRFMGRDYPVGSGGEGGNLSCFFKNSKVYIELEGCRPNRTQRMSAFAVKIYNLDGRLLNVYLDNEGEPFPLDAPQTSRGWRVTSKRTPAIASHLTHQQLSTQIESVSSSWSEPYCNYSGNQGRCASGGQDPGGALQAEHQRPGRLVREIHDVIMAVAR